MTGLTLSCGGASPTSRVVGSPSKPTLVVAQGSAAGVVAAPTCREAAPTGSVERARGVDALLSAQPREAHVLFETALRQNPGDLGAETLRIASSADLQRANQRSRSELEGEPLLDLPALPLTYKLVHEAPVQKNQSFKIEKTSQTKNLITDDAAWLSKNGLTDVSIHASADRIPEFMAATLRGNPLGRLFIHGDHAMGVYGELLAAFAPGKRPRQFDLTHIAKSGGTSLEVDFAQIVGPVLLLQLSHNGYAKEVNGKHAFVVALRVDDGSLLWSSEPLVGNARSFAVLGSHVVSGYGFTREPDFLFVLDLATGKTEEKIPMASGPSSILRKADSLFVRTYDTDVTFRISPANVATLPASFEESQGTSAPTIDPVAHCLVSRALAQIDAHDPDALRETIDALRIEHGDDTLVKAFSGAQSFLQERAKRPGIDLSTRSVVVVETPPWEYAFRGVGKPSAPTKKPGLLQLSNTKLTSGGRPVKKRATVSQTEPVFIAPFLKGALPNGARSDIPSSFGVDDLRAIIPSGDRSILIYGGRYVAIVSGSNTDAVLDFQAYLHPPKADPQTAEFAVEDVTYAQIEGTILYVANGGGSYARDVFGKKGFMSAVDVTTGKLIWRSDALVANSTFVVSGDFIATGYGFTDEADWLYLLRRDSGKVAAKSHLDSGPESVKETAPNRLHVETYQSSYEFEVRP